MRVREDLSEEATGSWVTERKQSPTVAQAGRVTAEQSRVDSERNEISTAADRKSVV